MPNIGDHVRLLFEKRGWKAMIQKAVLAAHRTGSIAGHGTNLGEWRPKSFDKSFLKPRPLHFL